MFELVQRMLGGAWMPQKRIKINKGGHTGFVITGLVINHVDGPENIVFSKQAQWMQMEK